MIFPFAKTISVVPLWWLIHQALQNLGMNKIMLIKFKKMERNNMEWVWAGSDYCDFEGTT